MDIGNVVQLAIGLVLHVWLLALVLRRNIRLRFSWFVAYCIFAIAGTAARLAAALWSDWAYLNDALGQCLTDLEPANVLVVDPSASTALQAKAPGLWAWASSKSKPNSFRSRMAS